jgi:hypothetical protein
MYDAFPMSPRGTRTLAVLRGIGWLFLTVGGQSLVPLGAQGEEIPANGVQPGIYKLYGAFDSLPGVQDPQTRDLWAEAMRLEAQEDLLASASVYEEVVRKVPDHSVGYWRVSRNYYRYGDELPGTRKDEKIKYLDLGAEWSGRGLEVDPQCGECCLYRFTSLATLAMTRGVWTAVRKAKEMSELLDRGIALRPTQADNAWNTTLGNLYYAASHFYRITPEWLWLRWLIGFQGDRGRALDYARRAQAISPMRIDYNVTLAAALLCVGTESDAPDLVAEGMRVLQAVDTLQDLRGYDAEFRQHARMLAASPESACRYSPEGLIDVKGELAKGRRAVAEDAEKRSAEAARRSSSRIR